MKNYEYSIRWHLFYVNFYQILVLGSIGGMLSYTIYYEPAFLIVFFMVICAFALVCPDDYCHDEHRKEARTSPSEKEIRVIGRLTAITSIVIMAWAFRTVYVVGSLTGSALIAFESRLLSTDLFTQLSVIMFLIWIMVTFAPSSKKKKVVAT